MTCWEFCPQGSAVGKWECQWARVRRTTTLSPACPSVGAMTTRRLRVPATHPYHRGDQRTEGRDSPRNLISRVLGPPASETPGICAQKENSSAYPRPTELHMNMKTCRCDMHQKYGAPSLRTQFYHSFLSQHHLSAASGPFARTASWILIDPASWVAGTS